MKDQPDDSSGRVNAGILVSDLGKCGPLSKKSFRVGKAADCRNTF